MSTSYLVEEAVGDHHRALAASISNDAVIISMAFDNAVTLQISLDELKFIARAAATLPQWLLDADGAAGPSRHPDDPKEFKTTQTAPAAKSSKPERPKPDRHGQKWDDAEDQKLVDAYQVEEKSVRAIALDFGRSPSSIVSRLLHLEVVEVKPKR